MVQMRQNNNNYQLVNTYDVMIPKQWENLGTRE